jgi:flavodoxin
METTMPQSIEMTRRNALAGTVLAGFSASLGLTSSAAEAQQSRESSRTLVVYFTRSGNTKVIAGKVRRDLDAELFEIQPATAYPEDYEATVAQAEQEKQTGYEPALKELVADIGAYTTVYLGFPIWGSTAPTVIKSFLSKHDLTGKDLVPLVTHGGYGTGDSIAVLRRMAPKSRLRKEFVIRMDQERAILRDVSRWLASSDARK